MRVTLRPTKPADLVGFIKDLLPHRIKAITALIGDRVIGIGGIGFRPDGIVIAFAELSDEFRKYPIAVHRAGRMGMALIEASGMPMIVAEAQANNPAAEQWLLHFGFRAVDTCGVRAFVWTRPGKE